MVVSTQDSGPCRWRKPTSPRQERPAATVSRMASSKAGGCCPAVSAASSVPSSAGAAWPQRCVKASLTSRMRPSVSVMHITNCARMTSSSASTAKLRSVSSTTVPAWPWNSPSSPRHGVAETCTCRKPSARWMRNRASYGACRCTASRQACATASRSSGGGICNQASPQACAAPTPCSCSHAAFTKVHWPAASVANTPIGATSVSALKRSAVCRCAARSRSSSRREARDVSTSVTICAKWSNTSRWRASSCRGVRSITHKVPTRAPPGKLSGAPA
jgi:hypothetical protein